MRHGIFLTKISKQVPVQNYIFYLSRDERNETEAYPSQCYESEISSDDISDVAKFKTLAIRRHSILMYESEYSVNISIRQALKCRAHRLCANSICLANQDQLRVTQNIMFGKS
jgi:hypothetical protein